MYQSDNKKTMIQMSVVRCQLSDFFIFRSLSSVFYPLFSVFFFLFSFFCLLSFVSFAQENIIYEDKGKRDPFIALVTPDGRLLDLDYAGGETKIVLEGIIYDKDGRCYAIINDEVVGIGDYIQDYAVLKIETDSVILLKDNQPVEYRLNEDETYGTE